MVFQVASPPADVMSADVLVAELAEIDSWPPLPQSRAEPVFGVLRCLSAVEPCRRDSWWGPADQMVWLVVWPDDVGAAGDVWWLLIEGDGILAKGYLINDPRAP